MDFNQAVEKASDNVRVILNNIHSSLFLES